MTYLPANDATEVPYPLKTEGFMTWLPVNDARMTRFFCLGMTSFPADDARRHVFFLHRTAALELDLISDPMGVHPRALSQASVVALELGNIAERP